MYRRWLAVTLFAFAIGAKAQTWCGKNYKSGQPIVPPGGQFPIPPASDTPLLAFRCAQAIRPYLPGDEVEGLPSAILIDTSIVHSHIDNAKPISGLIYNTGLTSVSINTVDVKVFVDGHLLTSGSVPLNVTKYELPFSLSDLQPNSKSYRISCIASFYHESQTFSTSSLLTYLPDPPSEIGSVTRMDLRTGALLARPADGKGGPYSPVFPIGFYTNYGGYLNQNLSIPAELASQGFTIIHPIPSFDENLEEVLDAIQDAGLYLMYDMRHTYMNSTAVTEEVNRIKSRPNLLLWYTADEPDGTSDPLDDTMMASNLISSLDGGDGQGGIGYHPVSLVLNCEDYYFTQYAGGADIVMQDAYPVDIDATWSTVWDTPCTLDFGCCGCDNCEGSFQDISTRMDEYRRRLFINGWERTKAIWTVPQAFGQQLYWPRYPTGREFIVESIVGINHGALGVIPWNIPTTSDIMMHASKLAMSLEQMSRFILSPSASFRQIAVNGVDCGLWTVDSQTLVLAANTNYTNQIVTLACLGLPTGLTITQVLDTGSSLTPAQDGFTFTSVGSGGFIVGSTSMLKDINQWSLVADRNGDALTCSMPTYYRPSWNGSYTCM